MTRTTHRRKPTYTTRSRNKRRRQKSGFIATAALAVCAILLCVHLVSAGRDKNSSHTAAGDYTTVITNPELDQDIISYKGMTVNFNPSLHIPNWVSWELTAGETTGTEPRAKQFVPDPGVDGCARTEDYTNTGYDRGHMAPAGDMKWDKEAMRQTFYLTNIAPQSAQLNRGPWNTLEQKCRDRARRDSAIYIVCGPILSGAHSIDNYIGTTRVAVPARYFKVIISPYANPPRGIGFIMPNNNIKGGMQPYAVTIDSVEAATGHDFFSELPDELELHLESQCNFNQWSRLK